MVFYITYHTTFFFFPQKDCSKLRALAEQGPHLVHSCGWCWGGAQQMSAREGSAGGMGDLLPPAGCG